MEHTAENDAPNPYRDAITEALDRRLLVPSELSHARVTPPAVGDE